MDVVFQGRIGGGNRAKGQTKAERHMVATIAAAGRELTKDMDLTPLAAFDLLQRQAARAKWLIIYILCRDLWTIMPTMSADEAMRQIQEHGGAIGMIGVTSINRRFQILKRPFLKGAQVNALLEKAGDGAADRLLALLERDDVKRLLLESQK